MWSSDRKPSKFKEFSITCKDCGLVFTHMGTYKTHLHQHALEEEEAQMGDEAAPAAGPAAGILDDAQGRDGDTSGDADMCDVSRSAQTQPSEFLQEAGVHTASTKSTLGKVYACLICGKVYTYLVSFQKHQKQHDNEPAEEKSLEQSEQNLRKYECPDCGMSFIRRSRLIGHLKVHRSNRRYKATPAKCDQCNKYFTSAKSWLAHLDLHKQKRFWCLSCAQGFLDEVSLDKHLQNHGLRQHRQNIIARSPYLAQQLTSHLNTHERVKPHQCPCCGNSFWHPEELLEHRQKQCGVDLGISGNPPESSAFEDSEEDTQNGSPLTGFKDDAEIKTALPDTEELINNQEKIERNEDQSLLKDSEVGGPEDSEESDCGEPVHCFHGTKPTACNDPSDGKKSEQELGESEPNKHREHKYWEWECTECDMGFDEMAMLHLHYIQHATGEVPIPHHDLEG